MNYDEAINYIHDTLKFGSKLGLHNITRLLELMGNPHKKLKYVHVAGTNGKGSTVAFISSILIESGCKVGIFTSPFIQRFSERIKINHTEISAEDLARITGLVKEKVEIMIGQGYNHPTEFEIVTAIAFQHYFECRCDIVVLEVGLGGRFDSTNVIDTPELAVITTISYDHMDRLGNTLPEIAFEKAGIIKGKGDVTVYPQENEVEAVFEKICLEREARLHKVDFSRLKLVEWDIEGQLFDYNGYKALRIALLGEHQTQNASVAVRASEILREKGFAVTEASIRKGLANARWPGRLEVINRSPVFLIDGAHNAEGAKALYGALNTYFPEKRITFILGVLRDKEYRSMIEAVVPVAHRFIAITPKSDRALPATELAKILQGYCKNVVVSDTIEEAIRTSLQFSDGDDVICAFGSLYYIGGIRGYFID